MSTSNYTSFPKLLPQVIKAIADLHEPCGSGIQDIVGQVQTNMAFYGIKPSSRNIKNIVYSCLRQGVRLGCFRVESQGKFRINKLKYCIPVFKSILSPQCVNYALRNDYLIKHSSNLEKKMFSNKRKARKPKEPRSPNPKSYIDQESENGILPILREPLTSYKKKSNTSVICIYDPAGQMNPQMESARRESSLHIDVDEGLGSDISVKQSRHNPREAFIRKRLLEKDIVPNMFG